VKEIKKILVPLDFSDYSFQALEYAKAIAEKFNAEIILLNVVEPVMFIADLTMGQINIPSIESEMLQRSEEKMKETIDTLKNNFKVNGIVKLGKPDKEIIDLANSQRVDLIVIGTHGHSKVEHLLFGSTAEKVIRRSNCSVLIIKPVSQS